MMFGANSVQLVADDRPSSGYEEPHLLQLRCENATAAARQPQAGVAAIELSLTLVILLMIVFAIVGYGALFWVKQSMSTVAADTARHALLTSYTTPTADVAADATSYACSAAQQIAVLRAFSDLRTQGSCGDFAGAQLGAAGACATAVATSATAYRCLTVRLKLTVDNWPLLNTMRQFAGVLTSNPNDWVPIDLITKATVLIAPAPPNP